MKICITNKQIWKYSNLLNEAFSEGKNAIFPIKLAYIIEFNKSVLYQKYELIERSRMAVGKKYGVLDENNEGYKISSENLEKAEKELEQLFEIEQMVDIMKIPLKDLENCDISLKQMEALLFMIEEE